MADKIEKTVSQLSDRAGLARLAPAEMMAVALSVVWVIAVVAFVLRAPEGVTTPGLVMTLMMVFLPLALIWAAVTTLRSVRALRYEAAQLQAAVEAMRAAYVTGQAASGGGSNSKVEQKLEEIAAAQKHTDSVLATFTSRRDTTLVVPSADRKTALALPVATSEGDEQPALALGTPAEALRKPLSVGDFILALQFPENPDDRDGFRALRLALEDRTVAKLIRSAQDVLTLLSQEGIYMDDLKPERARPEVWRRFASGERGRAIAGLGGIRDRSSLALAGSRMRSDPIFRDAAHHFLRTFDKTFAEFEKNATDTELANLSDTRTARAFMLLGRTTGTFD